MADEPRRPAKAEAWWGSILGAAREGATTAEVWRAIREYSASTGAAMPPNLFQEVNRMRSLASGLRYASDRLGRASSGDVITSDMIGRQVYARPGPGQALAPLYHVRFQMTTQQAGVEGSGWYTLEYSGALPATVGQLHEDVMDYALGLSSGYGVELVELGDVEIGEW